MTAQRDERETVQEQLARLRTQGLVVALTDPVRVGEVLTGAADEYARVCAENAELRERLRAIRQTVFRHLREPGQRGELARDVEAEADPHPEPAEVTL